MLNRQNQCQETKYITLTRLFIYFGKYFSLRSGEEHRKLRFSQLEFIEGHLVERTRLKYRSFAEKNYAGGLQYRKVKAKVVEHHKNIVNPERCVVSLYKKYVSKCPNDVIGGSVFYLTPNGSGVQVMRFGFLVHR